MSEITINGVSFTIEECKLLQTVKLLLEDTNDVSSTLDFDVLTTKDEMSVIKKMAQWFLNHRNNIKLDCAYLILSNLLETHNIKDFESHMKLFKTCNYFDFELITAPLGECTVALLPEDTDQLRTIFGIENDDFTEEEKLIVAKEIEQMEIVLPQLNRKRVAEEPLQRPQKRVKT